jgi:hypothetical protein
MGRTFLSADSGDFPVAAANPGQECPAPRRAGKRALLFSRNLQLVEPPASGKSQLLSNFTSPPAGPGSGAISRHRLHRGGGKAPFHKETSIKEGDVDIPCVLRILKRNHGGGAAHKQGSRTGSSLRYIADHYIGARADGPENLATRRAGG